MSEQKYSRDAVLKSLMAKSDLAHSPQDVHALQTIYRIRGTLERMWTSHVSQPKKLPDIIKHILNLGVFELHFAERSQAYATVSECVERAKKFSKPHSGLVNAVLKKVANAPAPEIRTEENFPTWVHKKWLSEGTPETVRSREKLLLEPPQFVCGPQDHPELRASLADYLGNKDKRIWVQSHSSRYVVDVLSRVITPGATFLDLCAGKGGKTIGLLGTGRDDFTAFVCDRSKEQLEILEENVSRIGFSNKVHVLEFHEAIQRKYDVVLIDAPCTGSGTWNKHPRGKWICTSESLQKLAVQQRELLEVARKCLEPGGKILYSVCSLFSEEGSQHFSRETHDISVATDYLVKHGANFSDREGILIEPGKGFEGFYLRLFTL